MSRPKLVSDDEVLDAARRVMLRLGAEPFTLSDVALEVGLSRAALIQRFGNRAGLHLRVAERDRTLLAQAIAASAEGRGAKYAWTFLRGLVGGMGDEDRLPAQLLLYREDMVEPALNAIARDRNAMIRDALAARLPETAAHSPAEMASLLQAVLQGAILQWGIDRHGTQKAHILAQLRLAFALLLPPDEPA